MLKRIGWSLCVAVMIAGSVFGATIKGTVTSSRGEAIENASVRVKNSVVGTTTDAQGRFELEHLQQGKMQLVLSHLGFAPRIVLVNLVSEETVISEQLMEAAIEMSEVVVTASRSQLPVESIPANVSVISAEELEHRSAVSMDDMLAQAPGVDVRRSSGIYTMSPMVTLRGTSGNEPSRTLVMVDGVPMNKSDTGEANWNRIKPEDVGRIEIVRGPASAVYGANAMGGVINIITRDVQDDLKVSAYGEGGTYGTYGAGATVLYGRETGKNQAVDLMISGSTRESDGYISTPEEQRTDYTIERFLEEKHLTAKLGYRFGRQKLTASYQRYDDKRGEGEKIRVEDGEARDFDTDFYSLRLQGGVNQVGWTVTAFSQVEDYARIDERMRNDVYSRFDVESERSDRGVLSQFDVDAEQFGQLAFGFDAKEGRVDGADVYKTSPDVVANKGTLQHYSAFLQDELDVSERIHVSMGVRLDQVSFVDGEINSSMAPWDSYNGSLDEHEWTEFSPRFGVSYHLNHRTKFYGAYGKAFRASILDDLCRSGWMWVGPKIANPELEPEVMHNIEVGATHSVGQAFFNVTGYYARGNDFLYYVNTDQTIFGGRMTLKQRQNVAEVDFYGVETGVRVPVADRFTVSGGYTYSHSKIKDFPEMEVLQGRGLDYAPEHKGSVTLEYTRWLTAALTWELMDEQFYTGRNAEEVRIPGQGLVHVKLSAPLAYGLKFALDVRNVFDIQHVQSETSLDPGRFVMGRLGYDFSLKNK